MNKNPQQKMQKKKKYVQLLYYSVENLMKYFQIQWLFNDKPVHGKSFLVSVSGDRQVLTIPEASKEHVGSISCVAENSAGRATCTAQLDVKGDLKQFSSD